MAQPDFAAGVTTTVAGSGRRGFVDGDRLGQAYLDGPLELLQLPDGKIIITDGRNNCLRMLDLSSNVVTTVPSHAFLGPRAAVVIDGGRAVVVCDSGHHRIRMLQLGTNADGSMSVQDCAIAGTGRVGHKDGVADVAAFNKPCGLAVLSDGSILVADSGNHAIRRIAGRPGKQGLFVSTIIGGYGAGFVDGDSTTSRLRNPTSLAVDAHGTVVVVDGGNHAVRALHPPPDADFGSPMWAVTTLAGDGRQGYSDGDACTEARLRDPVGITVGPNGEVVICDAGNNAVRALVGAGDYDIIGTGSDRLGNGCGLFRITATGIIEAIPALSALSGPAERSAVLLRVGGTSALELSQDGGIGEYHSDATATGTATARRVIVASPYLLGSHAAAASTSMHLSQRQHSSVLTALSRLGLHPFDSGTLSPAQVVMHPDPASIAAAHARYSQLMTIAGAPPAVVDVVASAARAIQRAGAHARNVQLDPSLIAAAQDASQAVQSLLEKGQVPSASSGSSAGAASQVQALASFSRYNDGPCDQSRFRRPHAAIFLANGFGSLLISDTANNFIRAIVSTRALIERPPSLASILTPTVVVAGRGVLAALQQQQEAEEAALLASLEDDDQPNGARGTNASHGASALEGVGGRDVPTKAAPARTSTDRSETAAAVTKAVSQAANHTSARRPSLDASQNASSANAQPAPSVAHLPSNSKNAPAQAAAMHAATAPSAPGAAARRGSDADRLDVDALQSGRSTTASAAAPASSTRQASAAESRPAGIVTKRASSVSQAAQSRHAPGAEQPMQAQPPAQGRRGSVSGTAGGPRYAAPTDSSLRHENPESLSPERELRSMFAAAYRDHDAVAAGAADRDASVVSATLQRGHHYHQDAALDGGSVAAAAAHNLHRSSVSEARHVPAASKPKATQSPKSARLNQMLSRSSDPLGAGLLAAAALSASGMSSQDVQRLTDDPDALLNASAALLDSSQQPDVFTKITPYTVPTAAGSRRNSMIGDRSMLSTGSQSGIRGHSASSTHIHSSRPAAPAGAAVGVEQTASLPSKGRPVGWKFEHELAADRRGGLMFNHDHASSRDAVASADADATGLVVKALLLGDHAENPASSSYLQGARQPGAPNQHVTTAPPALLNARYTRHTFTSAVHVREKGQSVLRTAPAFVNVSAVVQKKVGDLRAKAGAGVAAGINFGPGAASSHLSLPASAPVEVASVPKSPSAATKMRISAMKSGSSGSITGGSSGATSQPVKPGMAGAMIAAALSPGRASPASDHVRFLFGSGPSDGGNFNDGTAANGSYDEYRHSHSQREGRHSSRDTRSTAPTAAPPQQLQRSKSSSHSAPAPSAAAALEVLAYEDLDQYRQYHLVQQQPQPGSLTSAGMMEAAARRNSLVSATATADSNTNIGHTTANRTGGAVAAAPGSFASRMRRASTSSNVKVVAPSSAAASAGVSGAPPPPVPPPYSKTATGSAAAASAARPPAPAPPPLQAHQRQQQAGTDGESARSYPGPSGAAAMPQPASGRAAESNMGSTSSREYAGVLRDSGLLSAADLFGAAGAGHATAPQPAPLMAPLDSSFSLIRAMHPSFRRKG